MEKLTDFKPLEKVKLPGLGELDCKGLTIIVGPNSSGKSQLLKDIRERVSGQKRDLVVAEEIAVRTPEYTEFISCLKKEGYIYSFFDDSDTEQLMPMTSYLGTGQAAGQIQSAQGQQWHQTATTKPRIGRKNEYLDWCGKFLVTALFLENRLTATNAVNNIDFEKAAPQNDLHAFHIDDGARESLFKECVIAFTKAIWSDSSRGTQLCLRVSDESDLPKPEERLSPKAMAKYRTIQDEGDGMKSYVATCISILLGRRPVSVIDEPEMCLHPPQAYNLGKFIGRFATSPETATFVATHSSHILRGVIQVSNAIQIIRMTRNSSGFSAHYVESSILREALKKPTVRAETILDGIFSQGVAVVEGDSDRTVYQACWEAINDKFNLDIHFATVGGTGGMADTCQMYQILGIPVTVICDLDVLTTPTQLLQILDALSVEEAQLETIASEINEVAEYLQKLPPTVDESQAKKAMAELSEAEYNWKSGDDRTLLTKLSKLRNSINGMRRLKRGGIEALPDEVRPKTLQLIESLAVHGLFILKIGELEEWLSKEGLSASKNNKWAWANEAAHFLRSTEPKQDDIWSFMSAVGLQIKTVLNADSNQAVDSTE